MLGGSLALHTVVPLLDVDFRANGARFKSSGLGDIAVGAALGYHASPALHYLFGVDVYAPTGKYDAKDPSSLGKNYWTIQPLAALTYTQPTGLNADLKVMYDFNQRNNDTRTRSGQAIHADYSLGWGLGGGLGGAGWRAWAAMSTSRSRTTRVRTARWARRAPWASVRRSATPARAAGCSR